MRPLATPAEGPVAGRRAEVLRFLLRPYPNHFAPVDGFIMDSLNRQQINDLVSLNKE